MQWAFLYLLGQAGAIRRTAESRSSFWTGLVLVLTASIARNYDQVFVLEKPLAFVEPLFFSSASAAFFFFCIYFLFIRPLDDAA